MNSYITLKNQHQKEVDGFPFFFAFTKDQYEEGMRKFGLKSSDTDKICRLGSTGGFLLKTDRAKMHEMFGRHERERKEAIAADKTGNGYIYDMFNTELSNHEYVVTGDITDTLDALGMEYSDIVADQRIERAFHKARKNQKAFYD